ncbi:MAG: TonB-dependent receptor plug domain-containing protein [Candidatus Eiseniibacteriota bacterium]
MRRAGIAVLATVSLGLSGPPLAHAAPASPVSPARADTLVVPLEQMNVTGSRIPETVLRTPAAVSLVERRDFTHSRLLGLDEALGGVPGVLAQSRAGAQDVRITIRGFGARGNGERSNAGTTRGVLILSDGVPLTEPDGRTSLDLADLGTASRIEISRSNASALYGNASGGVVHLRSNLDFPARFAEVAGRAGAFGFHRKQGALGLVSGASTRS